MSPLALPLLVAAAALAAWVVASLVVAVLDRLGLVYSPEREERRHAVDADPALPRIVVIVQRADLVAAIAAALDRPPADPEPIRRRIRARRRPGLRATPGVSYYPWSR